MMASTLFSHVAAQALARGRRGAKAAVRMTVRERQVIATIADGLSNNENCRPAGHRHRTRSRATRTTSWKSLPCIPGLKWRSTPTTKTGILCPARHEGSYWSRGARDCRHRQPDELGRFLPTWDGAGKAILRPAPRRASTGSGSRLACGGDRCRADWILVVRILPSGIGPSAGRVGVAVQERRI